MAIRDLTAKQRRFIDLYLSNGRNAADAYRQAYGVSWSPQRCAEEGFRLLRNPKVSPILAEADKRAEAAVEKTLNRYAVTEERVVEALARLGFYDARDVFEWSETGIRLKPSDTITDDAAAAITEISQTTTKEGGTIRVKLADKRAALVDLGRHLGMFKEQVNHTFEGAEGVTDAELAEIIRAKADHASRGRDGASETAIGPEKPDRVH